MPQAIAKDSRPASYIVCNDPGLPFTGIKMEPNTKPNRRLWEDLYSFLIINLGKTISLEECKLS